MLNAGVLRFDATGRIRQTASSSTDGNGGTPTIQGLLSAGNVAIEAGWNGLPYFNSGQGILCGQGIGTTVSFAPGGIPMNSAGMVEVDAVGAIAYWNAGLPYTAAHRLAVALPESPVAASAFDNGFDSGFH
jgi:hypothetical protein